MDFCRSAIRVREHVIYPALQFVDVPSDTMDVETYLKVTHQFAEYLIQSLVLRA